MDEDNKINSGVEEAKPSENTNEVKPQQTSEVSQSSEVKPTINEQPSVEKEVKIENEPKVQEELNKQSRFSKFKQWFNNLSKSKKIALCAGVGVCVVSVVVFPTLGATVWSNKVYDFTNCSWNDMANVCTQFEKGEINETTFCNKFKINGVKLNSLSDFIGKERIVEVNGQNHRVRVIGANHTGDKIVRDNKITSEVAALTFEFANVICDANGNSLGYQWNDTKDTSTANYDYRDSTIRFALDGEGTNSGKQKETESADTILVSEKGANSWSKTYNKTVFSMLPEDLQSSIKKVNKTVGVSSGEGFNEKNCGGDTLFLLSGVELGNTSASDKGYGEIYDYYNIHTESEYRVKKPVNNEVYSDYTMITNKEGFHQLYSEVVANMAGWNDSKKSEEGSCYLTRSPIAGYQDVGKCFSIWSDGEFDPILSYAYTYSIAPAFCI